MITSNFPQLSYWEKDRFFQKTDVLIIGSGIVGLTAAIAIKQKAPQTRVTIVERGPLPSGASTRNAGFACFGSPSELIEDLKHHTEEEVLTLLEKRWRGLQELRKLLGEEAIRYREWGGYEIFREGEEAIYQSCLEKLEDLNLKVKAITGREKVYQNADQEIRQFGFSKVKHLLVNQAEGQIDTGRMMYALLQKAREMEIEIINGLGISALHSQTNGVAITCSNGWEIAADKVLVATNGFAATLLPQLSVQPARNQVLITQPIDDLKIKGCFHYERGYYYFRNINSRILLGGGRNLAPMNEQTNIFGTSSLIQDTLLQLLEEVILPGQKVAIDQWWSGILGVGEQKTSIVKEIEPNVVVAVRMGGMGIAIGSLIGKEGAQLIL